MVTKAKEIQNKTIKLKKTKSVETSRQNSKVEITPTVKKKFEYTRLSSSMMKTWLKCKREFYFNYILGYYKPPQEHFTLGTAVHKALEVANRSLQQKPRDFNAFEIEDFVQTFREEAAKAHILNMELFETGEEIVKEELSQYSKKEKILGVETEFDVTTSEGVRIYGFIDKLVQIDSTTLKIIDYKTSTNPMSYEDAKYDEQLSMYDLAISLLYPDIPKRILELRYVKTGDIINISRSDIERHNFRLEILAVDKAIKDFIKNTKEIPAGDINSYCGWCAFKNSCPRYKEYMTTMLPDVPQSLELTDQDFMEKWELIEGISSMVTKWKEELKLWAVNRLAENPDVPIKNTERELYLSSATRREYDVSEIAKIIGLEDLLGASTNGIPLIKFQTKPLDQYLKNKNDKKINAKVEKHLTIKFNNPSMRFRNIGR